MVSSDFDTAAHPGPVNSDRRAAPPAPHLTRAAFDLWRVKAEATRACAGLFIFAGTLDLYSLLVRASCLPLCCAIDTTGTAPARSVRIVVITALRVVCAQASGR